MEADEGTWSFTSYFAMLWAGIASVGWYIVGVAIALFFAAPYLEEKYRVWKKKRDEAEYAAKYHKNSDLLEERLNAIEKARQQMQEKYYMTAKTAREMEEKRKEAKQQELQKLMESQRSGQRLGNADDGASTSKASTSRLHNEYNPLMGDSTRGYRPPKRSCCGKGGCG